MKHNLYFGYKMRLRVLVRQAIDKKTIFTTFVTVTVWSFKVKISTFLQNHCDVIHPLPAQNHCDVIHHLPAQTHCNVIHN